MGRPKLPWRLQCTRSSCRLEMVPFNAKVAASDYHMLRVTAAEMSQLKKMVLAV